MKKKYKIWDWFPAQTIEEWEDQYKRMLGMAFSIPSSERKDSIHKPLFVAIKEIEKFLKSKGKKFIY